jgi:hypothetical protein
MTSSDPFLRMWRTVVVAGAMLATPAVVSAGENPCGPGKSTGTEARPTDPNKPVVAKKKKKKKKRVRGSSDKDKPPVGRGFILA